LFYFLTSFYCVLINHGIQISSITKDEFFDDIILGFHCDLIRVGLSILFLNDDTDEDVDDKIKEGKFDFMDLMMKC